MYIYFIHGHHEAYIGEICSCVYGNIHYNIYDDIQQEHYHAEPTSVCL